MKKIIYSIIALLFVIIYQLFGQDSMYVHLKTGVAKFSISDIDSVKFEKTSAIQFNYFISKTNSPSFIHYSSAIPSINAAYDYAIIYNNSSSTNLNDLVWATASNGIVEKKFADYGLGTAGVNYQFVFSSSFTYNGMDGVTNQNSYIQIQSDGKITVVGGTSAIDRTPVVKVELKNMSGVLLAQAYIKFKIVSTTTPPVSPNPVNYNIPSVTYSYSSLFKDAVSGVSAGDVTDVSLSWVSMNQIYNSIGVSRDDFQAIYGSTMPTVGVKVNDVVVPNATLAQYPLIRSTNSPDVDTYAMKCQITPLAKFGTTSVTYTFTPGSTSYPVLNITFNYTILKPAINILTGYQNPDANSCTCIGMQTQDGYKMQVYLGEPFGFNTGEYAQSFGASTLNKIDGATHTFAFSESSTNRDKAEILPGYGGTINTSLGSSFSNYTGQILILKSPMSVSLITFNLEFITNYPNGEKSVFPFNVIFKNPITVEGASGNEVTLTDFNSGVCDEKPITLSKNSKVKFMGQDVIINGVPTSIAANYGIAASNYSYGINIDSDYKTLSLTNEDSSLSSVKWCNAGAKLNAKTLVGTIDASFNSSFAKVSYPIHKIYCIPE